MACNCGKAINRNGAPVRRASASYVDPTRAAFAATRPQYLVVAHPGATTGKRFATLTKAQDYARSTGGILRSIG